MNLLSYFITDDYATVEEYFNSVVMTDHAHITEDFVLNFINKHSKYFKDNYNSVDKYNNTPLHYASSRGHTLIVKKLLKYGAQCTYNWYVQSPLRYASYHGHYDVAGILIPYCNVNDIDIWGYTCLHYAFIMKRKKIINR